MLTPFPPSTVEVFDSLCLIVAVVPPMESFKSPLNDHRWVRVAANDGEGAVATQRAAAATAKHRALVL